MAEKIWEFGTLPETIKTPYEFLYEYASKLKEDTDDLIEGTVTEVVSQSSDNVILALYLVVPELKHYSYRLIEIIQPNIFTPYPVTLKLFGPWPNFVMEQKDIDEKEFDKMLRIYISQPVTQQILARLKNQIYKQRESRIPL